MQYNVGSQDIATSQPPLQHYSSSCCALHCVQCNTTVLWC